MTVRTFDWWRYYFDPFFTEFLFLNQYQIVTTYGTRGSYVYFTIYVIIFLSCLRF